MNPIPLADSQADIHTDIFDIFDTALCMDGSLFLYPGADNSMVVWDLDSQKELGRLLGHDTRITVVAARGNLAVSAQLNTPFLWNLETMQCAATLPDASEMYSACGMEGKVLLGSMAGPIKLWDVAASARRPAQPERAC